MKKLFMLKVLIAAAIAASVGVARASDNSLNIFVRVQNNFRTDQKALINQLVVLNVMTKEEIEEHRKNGTLLSYCLEKKREQYEEGKITIAEHGKLCHDYNNAMEEARKAGACQHALNDPKTQEAYEAYKNLINKLSLANEEYKLVVRCALLGICRAVEAAVNSFYKGAPIAPIAQERKDEEIEKVLKLLLEQIRVKAKIDIEKEKKIAAQRVEEANSICQKKRDEIFRNSKKTESFIVKELLLEELLKELRQQQEEEQG
ncbi:MAG: hypothetical protein LBG13_02905 [Holosporales bacterium]|nr:hypothetical protein [Holosporales bacterium]